MLSLNSTDWNQLSSPVFCAFCTRSAICMPHRAAACRVFQINHLQGSISVGLEGSCLCSQQTERRLDSFWIRAVSGLKTCLCLFPIKMRQPHTHTYCNKKSSNPDVILISRHIGRLEWIINAPVHRVNVSFQAESFYLLLTFFHQ